MAFYQGYFYRDVKIPLACQRQWIVVLLKGTGKQVRPLPFFISCHPRNRSGFVEKQYLIPHPLLPPSWRIGLFFMPGERDYLRLYPLTKQDNASILSPALSIQLYPLTRIQAALLLIFNAPVSFFKTLFSTSPHLRKRIRLTLLQSQQKISPRLSYQTWCSFYDQWTKQEKNDLFQSPYRQAWPTLVPDPGFQTKQSKIHFTPPQRVALSTRTTHIKNRTYVILKQKEEILRPHSLAVFMDQAARHAYPAALYADSDEITHDNQRHDPLFKPDISLLPLLSGVLTQDPWLIRQDVFETFQKHTAFQSCSSTHAHRLAYAFFLWEKKLSIHHIPFLLSHRTAPPGIQDRIDVLKVVNQIRYQNNWKFSTDSSQFPFHVRFRNNQEPVSIIIPTTLGSETIQNCLSSLLTKTDYPQYEVILVVSQSMGLTAQQQVYLTFLKRHTNLRVLLFKTSTFNFSQSCNYAISQAKHPFIALVNDDVTPLDSGWLTNMMGYMQIDQIGAVGAKLYYPNGQIQHAGILMGAANLCEHIGRFQTPNTFFLTHDHEVSAVTGACMVIRKQAYEQIQGFNEQYEIAYNDVDFCLRLFQAGYQVMQCQQAHLIHHESLSLGHHYTGTRVGKEEQEILSLWKKFQHSFHRDPFYNPNLSLQRGMDYQLSFPPDTSIPFDLAE